jgi:uncharacterized protein involved in exopolysaccharide biosynthesis
VKTQEKAMSPTGVRPVHGAPATESVEPFIFEDHQSGDVRQQQAEQARLLWDKRRFLFRVAVIGLAASTLLAFLLPKRFTSTTQLMPPDPQSTSGLAMMAALASASKGAGSLGGMAGDLLGMKSSGAMFIGVLRSQTSQERLVEKFNLRKVYGERFVSDARSQLDERTAITEDKKSGIITIHVADASPERATVLAAAYVDQLNTLVAELSTSAAHRERVFLEERLKVVKQDLDNASNELAQFSSKNTTLDVETEGKAMLNAAATLAGQMIAAQSQLEGLRQIYTDSNPRVRSLTARVGELRSQLQKLGGGKEEVAADGTEKPRDSDMPYPSIHNLPLLGVKYTDYYRHAKIEETVYELLTEQYELAKVQEVKETPSVKVLDPAKIPERKSSPPRLLIMFLGTFFSFAFAIAWILGGRAWERADPRDPRKILLEEVFATVKAQAPWASRNGHASGSVANKIWDRISHR